MTKDILKLSAMFLGLENVLQYLNKEIEEEPKEVSDLIVFLNYVVYEVTKEYYPLSTEEVVTSDNQCRIYFSNLTQNAVAIKDVKDSYNLSDTFNLYPEFIKVGKPLTNYKVSYNYTPKPISSVGDALVLPLGLNYHVISYGVASEYALSKLLYDEADLWQTKFKNSLETIKSRVGERRIRARKLK